MLNFQSPQLRTTFTCYNLHLHQFKNRNEKLIFTSNDYTIDSSRGRKIASIFFPTCLDFYKNIHVEYIFSQFPKINSLNSFINTPNSYKSYYLHYLSGVHFHASPPPWNVKLRLFVEKLRNRNVTTH